MPGPAGAIAAAPLSAGRIAILAGTESAKGLFIIDEQSGDVLRSFGVTKEATGVSAQTEDGPLLISVGVERDGRMLGAVEQWSLEGTKERIVPLPTEGLGITRVLAGVAYVLLGGRDGARAAAEIRVPSLQVRGPVPLEANAKSLQQCRSDRGNYLLYTEAAHGWLMIRDLGSGGTARSAFAADGATCFGDGAIAYALVGSDLSKSVSVMSLPTLGEISSIPASRDAVALYESDDHHLVALNSNDRVASIETFVEQSEVVRTAASQLGNAEALSQTP